MMVVITINRLFTFDDRTRERERRKKRAIIIQLHCTHSLEEKGFVESVTDCVIKRDKKILGICVGMQLMGGSTEEDGGSKCFGFFENRVLKLKQKKGVKLPHVGFNSVSASSSSLFESIEQKDFYFVHSYALEVKNQSYEAGITEYNQKFVSVVIKDNIFGTQFHPEISQNNGLKLLNNFFNKC